MKDRLVFMDFITDQTENVFPMVPQARASEMILARGPVGDMMRHIISLLMENESGALSRVAGLFSARGYNIESLTVAPTEDPTLSRMTIVTPRLRRSHRADHQAAQQADRCGQGADLNDGAHIERELMLVKVQATGKDREEMKRMADIFRGRIIDVTDDTYIIELTGTGSKLDAFLEALDKSAHSGNRAYRCLRHRPWRSHPSLTDHYNFERKCNESLLRQGRRPLHDQEARKSPSSVTARKAMPMPRT